MNQRLLSDDYAAPTVAAISLLLGTLLGAFAIIAFWAEHWWLLALLPFILWQWWQIYRTAVVADTARRIVMHQLENLGEDRP